MARVVVTTTATLGPNSMSSYFVLFDNEPTLLNRFTILKILLPGELSALLKFEKNLLWSFCPTTIFLSFVSKSSSTSKMVDSPI